MLSDYIDLTDPACDLSHYQIEAVPGYNCAIIDDAEEPNEYSGFLLAKSRGGEACTICDVNFHYSDKDKRYGVRLTFRRTFKDGNDKTVNKGQYYQRISFDTGKDGYREFWKMIAFLEKFKECVDVGEFSDEFRVISKDNIVYETALKLKDIGDADERVQCLMKIIEQSKANDDIIVDLLSVKQRRQSINVFKLLLEDKEYRERYRKKYQIQKPGDEALWNHFFKMNKWIFGLNFDLRFTEDYLSEQSLGNPNTASSGSPVVDYLGLGNFTTLVEIKTPEKKYFKDDKSSGSRANTWSFHNEFIEAVSQCLGQKAAHLENPNKEIVDESGGVLDRRFIRTVDPKVILVYGNKAKELPDDDVSTNNFTKKDTLERYIRDSNNLMVVSFDELYARACAIVAEPSEK